MMMDIDGIKIENAQFADLKDKRLKNGEPIPTLKEYLEAAKPLGKVYDEHPTWIAKANKLGLITNVWTVNDLSEIKKFFHQGIGFVTTNEPEKAKLIRYI